MASYDALFQANIAVVCGALLLGRLVNGGGKKEAETAAADEGLKWRYLGVFLLFKLADWMQGPYFHDMYSKKVGGAQDKVAQLFLVGFGSAMVASLFVGKIVDTKGRRLASIAFALFFALTGFSTQSDDLTVLVLGRVMGGLATSLLYTAPEAWLMGECRRLGVSGAYIGAFFGWVYFLDSSVAIMAGWASEQLVRQSKDLSGTGEEDVTYPFLASSAVVLVATVGIALLWRENYADTAEDASEDGKKKTGGGESALSALLSSPRLLAIGAVQACVEGSMNVFVLNWGRALSGVSDEAIPYGTVFSCFMCCSMAGSTLGGVLKLSPAAQLALAAVVGIGGLAPTLLTTDAMHRCIGLCMYEAALGLYFPAIGTLRAAAVPDAHRASIMNYYRVPLNCVVVAGLLRYEQLGVQGGMAVVAASLGVVLVLAAGMAMAGAEKAKVE
eukprot:TRINITY_DN11504_c0_g1_i1.p1 TRINITY_DN11504_c0_g1~~TRINITY_DN11504_c0_g1_i1.p1  ORF type:complete len:443 (+),score=164.44 TRINITY_DN11504_c0_g1_i1:51-1379(+)